VAVRTGLVNERFIPAPTTVILELGVLATTPAFWVAMGQTLLGWALGLAIAALIAIPLSIAIVSVDVIDRALRPIIEFLRPVPSVALIPVAILLFGVGMDSKLFLVAFASTWPLLVQTMIGLRDIDPTQVATLQS